LVRDGGEQHRESYQELNGLAQVPTLTWEIEGETRVLTQSMAILEWLDAAYAEPAIVPRDAFRAAQVRELAEIVNAGIQPLQNLALLQKLKAEGIDAKAHGRDVITRGLSVMESMVSQSDGDFCVGDTPSLADICLVPQLYNGRRFNVDLEQFPALLAVESVCESHPAFAAAHPDRQPDAQLAGT